MPNAPRTLRPVTGKRVAVERVLGDRGRPNSNARGYTYQWGLAAKAFLGLNPLCRECAKFDLVVAATEVDHIIPHRGNMTLFWDRTNWQPLCEPCHKSKTGRGE